jgi:hypothetical protein
MGKSTISIGPFSIATLNYQRVKHAKEKGRLIGAPKIPRDRFNAIHIEMHPTAAHAWNMLESIHQTTHETGHSIGK